MDISHLRTMTQSDDLAALKANTEAITATLTAMQNPSNAGARWGAFMLGMCAACTIEGWVAHDIDSEETEPCLSLVTEFLDFCARAHEGAWFAHDPSLINMSDRLLTLESQRLKEDGWPEETYKHSYLFRFREYAFIGGDPSTPVYALPVTPEA